MVSVYFFVVIQGSPELLEVKMGTDGYSDGSDDNNRDIENDNSVEVSGYLVELSFFLLHRESDFGYASISKRKKKKETKIKQHDFLNKILIICGVLKEPMDTTESMKSDTPQPPAKEPSPQKEQVDNNITGMSC